MPRLGGPPGASGRGTPAAQPDVSLKSRFRSNSCKCGQGSLQSDHEDVVFRAESGAFQQLVIYTRVLLGDRARVISHLSQRRAGFGD